MNRPIQVAVIGCGGIMRSVYVPVLQGLTEIVNVAAVCDLQEVNSARVANAMGGGATTWTDARAMLEQGTFDAVMVLTDERATVSTACLALEFNVPIFLEKPPALNGSELDRIIAAEARSQTHVYTAFNRRHTPLFAGRDFSIPAPRHISGRLARAGRQITRFPNTAVHLLDSIQYFSRSLFQSWEVIFELKPAPLWTVNGKLENGATARLKFLPDVPEFAEWLVIEAPEHVWELHVPNEGASLPQGKIVRRRPGFAPSIIQTEKVDDFLEATGFRSCVRDFIAELHGRSVASPHRLSQSRSTVLIMDEMRSKAHS